MECLFLSVILFLCAGKVNSQASDSLLVIGKKEQLYSSVLQESREYWIHLPSGYDDNQHKDERYPVIYLLDGEQNFIPMVGIHAFLNRGPRARFPKVIVVGICNTDRTRDFTPTPSVSVKGQATMENSGGGEKFIAFLQQELIPHVESRYRTGEKRVLIGHSFGGLLTMHILLHHSALFTDYLALDPSFWWDDQHLLKESDRLLSNLKLNGVKLYLGRAAKDHSRGSLRKEDAKELLPDFRDILAKHKQSGLQWEYRDFEGETHGSLFLSGTHYGLRYLFSNE
jgi:predicted alpha/beta superfamily hydrolase